MLEKLIFVFIMSIITEVFYTSYVYYCSKLDTMRAPISSGLIGIFKALIVIAYVKDPLAILSLSIGQVIGTYLTLRYLKNKNKHRKE
jgi:hypothetical protein